MTAEKPAQKLQRSKWTSEQAIAIMRDAAFEPLEDYPGRAVAKWRCKCLRCGKESTPNLSKVRSGSRCYFCGRKAVSLARRTPEAAAVAEMQAAGLTPLVPFPDAENPWLSQCRACGREVRPRLTSVRRGWKGCRFCARSGGRARLNEELVVRDMLAAGLEPLEPYKSVKLPWLCRCLGCGREVRPRYGNVRLGHRGCTQCASRQFDRVGPALVYAYAHPRLRAVKIGVTSDLLRRRRLNQLSNGGWQQLKIWRCQPGELALVIERRLLAQLRERCGSQPFLRREDMPRGGHTETFDALVVEPAELVHLTDQAWAQVTV